MAGVKRRSPSNNTGENEESISLKEEIRSLGERIRTLEEELSKPRLPEPDRFSGDVNQFLEWERCIISYTKYHKMSRENEIMWIYHYLEGDALSCFNQLEEKEKTTLKGILGKLRERFIPKSVKLVLGEKFRSDKMRVGAGVNEYTRRFMKGASFQDMLDSQLIQQFGSSVTDILREDLILNNPSTIRDAYTRVRLKELASTERVNNQSEIVSTDRTIEPNNVINKQKKEKEEEIFGILPKARNEPYDMKEIIKRIVDNSEFDEYKEGFGKIGKKFFNLSLKIKNISINKILKRNLEVEIIKVENKTIQTTEVVE